MATVDMILTCVLIFHVHDSLTFLCYQCRTSSCPKDKVFSKMPEPLKAVYRQRCLRDVNTGIETSCLWYENIKEIRRSCVDTKHPDFADTVKVGECKSIDVKVDGETVPTQVCRCGEHLCNFVKPDFDSEIQTVKLFDFPTCSSKRKWEIFSGSPCNTGSIILSVVCFYILNTVIN
uniref:Protein quiver n=1 Tax=Clastoptera arizonana TaxID=38151 RepID=A0A1B6BZ38_9HEMI